MALCIDDYRLGNLSRNELLKWRVEIYVHPWRVNGDDETVARRQAVSCMIETIDLRKKSTDVQATCKTTLAGLTK